MIKSYPVIERDRIDRNLGGKGWPTPRYNIAGMHGTMNETKCYFLGGGKSNIFGMFIPDLGK